MPAQQCQICTNFVGDRAFAHKLSVVLGTNARAVPIHVIATLALKVGHNTDAYGFQQSIKPFLTNQHERALIFGTGGASKAIANVLKNLGIDVLFISRDPKGDKHFSYAEVNNHMLNACKLLVNCTPVGTLDYKDSKFDLPFEYLTSDHLVVDLVYNPPMTDLLLKSKQQGATILNGESMLKHQALQSWKIWNNQL